MTKTATLATRPPETLTATLPAFAEQVKEVVEMGNYALVNARQVVFDQAEDPKPAFLTVAGTRELYYVPVWVDEDAQDYRLRVAVTCPVGNTVAVIVNDGTNAWTTPDLTNANPTDYVDFAPVGNGAGGQGQHVGVTISLDRIAGADTVTIDWVRLEMAPMVATAIPAPGD